MRKLFVMVVLIFVILTISSCSEEQITNQIEEITETPTKAIPTTIPPTPTTNPFLLADSFQTKDAIVFGNGRINNMFVSKEHRNALIQTKMGIYLFDLDTMERLGFKQTDLYVLNFNGQEGYLLTPFAIYRVHRPDLLYSIDSDDLVHFSWDGNEFTFDNWINLKDWDGSNLVLSEAAISPNSAYIFGREDYRDDENNHISISIGRVNYGFWKDSDALPTTFLKDQKYDIRSQNIVFSPDESKIAFLGEVGGTVMSVGDPIVFLADITEEGLSIPKKIFEHRNFYVAIDFSPDSQRIASGDEEGQVMVYWIENQTQKVFYLAEEDFKEDRYIDLISDVRFLDNDHVAAATNSGNLVVWDINTEEKQVYSLNVDTPRKFFAVDNQTIVYCTNNGIFEYNLESRTNQGFNYDFGPIRSKDLIIGDMMASVTELGNRTAELEAWDVDSGSRIITKTLDYVYPKYPIQPELFALQNGNILIGAATDGTETAPILEIDTKTWNVIQANPENADISFEFGMFYSKPLNQYIAVGSNKHELVLTNSDDPVFMTIDDRKKTLREILDIDISKDGTQVVVLENNGLAQVINLTDPSLSKTIEFEAYLKYNIHFLDNDHILIDGLKYRWTSTYDLTLITLSTREVSTLQNDLLENCQVSAINTDINYPDGWISFNCNNGAVMYDILSDRKMKEYSFDTNALEKYFDWDYALFYKEGFLLGKDYYGYFKIKNIPTGGK